MKIYLAISGGGTGLPEPYRRRLEEMKIYLAGVESRKELYESFSSGKHNARTLHLPDDLQGEEP